MKKKFIICMSVVMLVVAMAAVTAFAAGDTTVVTLTEGSVSGGTITFADFPDVTLTGHQQVTAAVPWSILDITDGRGTGTGWTLALTLTQLEEPGGKTLPWNSIRMASTPGIVDEAGSSPASALVVYVGMGDPLDTGSPVDLLTAPAGEGMGSYNAMWSVNLTIPANAYVGTYTSTATVDMVIAP